MYADPGNCMSPVTEKEPRKITDKWFNIELAQNKSSEAETM